MSLKKGLAELPAPATAPCDQPGPPPLSVRRLCSLLLWAGLLWLAWPTLMRADCLATAQGLRALQPFGSVVASDYVRVYCSEGLRDYTTFVPYQHSISSSLRRLGPLLRLLHAPLFDKQTFRDTLPLTQDGSLYLYLFGDWELPVDHIIDPDVKNGTVEVVIERVQRRKHPLAGSTSGNGVEWATRRVGDRVELVVTQLDHHAPQDFDVRLSVHFPPTLRTFDTYSLETSQTPIKTFSTFAHASPRYLFLTTANASIQIESAAVGDIAYFSTTEASVDLGGLGARPGNVTAPTVLVHTTNGRVAGRIESDVTKVLASNSHLRLHLTSHRAIELKTTHGRIHADVVLGGAGVDLLNYTVVVETTEQDAFVAYHKQAWGTQLFSEVSTTGTGSGVVILSPAFEGSLISTSEKGTATLIGPHTRTRSHRISDRTERYLKVEECGGELRGFTSWEEREHGRERGGERGTGGARSVLKTEGGSNELLLA